MTSTFMIQKLTHIFNVFDLNGNGVLASEDFERLADNYVRETGMDPDSEATERFRALFTEWWERFEAVADADRGGTVTLDEWLAVLTQMAADPETFGAVAELLFDAIDTDGDGVIAVDEYEVFLKIYDIDASDAKDNFSRFDTDGDGSISRAEYGNLMIQLICGEDPDAPGNRLFGTPSFL